MIVMIEGNKAVTFLKPFWYNPRRHQPGLRVQFLSIFGKMEKPGQCY